MATRCPKCHADNPDAAAYCSDCGTCLSSIEVVAMTKTLMYSVAIGSLVAGKYKILGKLGEGGMGVVYKAEDIRLKRTVSLKFMPPELMRDAEAKERFVREAQAAAALSHPHICTIYEVDEDEGKPFIAMEYVEGQSLRERKGKGPLDLAEALGHAIQAAQGLEEAHKKKIIHRDVKSANIMVTRTGQAKVMDFGLAKVLGAPLITKEAKTMGTVAYMSPEQAQGQSVDHRTDIWSLGVVLYEILTGQLPFKGENDQSIIHCILNENPQPLTKVMPKVPKDLENIVLTALSKNPDSRYQNMGELLGDLRAIAEGLKPLRAKPWPAKGKILGVRKIYFYAASVVLLALLGAAGFFLSRGSESPLSAPSTTSIAVLPLSDLSQEKDQAAWCEGIAETILNSLANVKSLQVRGRHSSFQFTAQDDPGEVGKKLNADKLLTGSLWKFGNRLRVTVQLINPATGAPEWSDQEDGKMGEIFDIQDRIVLTIISRMNVEMLGDDRERLEKRYTNNPEAYDLYLKGNYAANRGTDVDVLRAVSLYLEAVQKDPNFVLAHIALARCYQELTVIYGVWPKEKAYRLTKEALDRAFALDSENGEAYAIRAGMKYFFENDPDGAELDYQRAFQLSPRNSMILRDRFRYLTTRGFLEEAESETQLLIEIDPVDPYGYWMLGLINYNLRRYGDSINAYEKALELDPGFVNVQGWSVFTYLAQGQYRKAHDMAKRFEHKIHDQYLFSMAIIEGSLGNKEAAEENKKALDEFMLENYSMPTPPFWEAAYSAVMGDRDATLANLTKLLSENQYGPVNDLLYWHFYDRYRSDPGFIALFKKVGFEMKQK